MDECTGVATDVDVHAHWHACLSVCLYVWPSVRRSVGLSVYLHFCMCVCMRAGLYMYGLMYAGMQSATMYGSEGMINIQAPETGTNKCMLTFGRICDPRRTCHCSGLFLQASA